MPKPARGRRRHVSTVPMDWPCGWVAMSNAIKLLVTPRWPRRRATHRTLPGASGERSRSSHRPKDKRRRLRNRARLPNRPCTTRHTPSAPCQLRLDGLMAANRDASRTSALRLPQLPKLAQGLSQRCSKWTPLRSFPPPVGQRIREVISESRLRENAEPLQLDSDEMS